MIKNVGKINKYSTLLAYLILWLHPLGIGFGIYMTNGNKIPMYVGILVFIYALLLIKTKILLFHTKKPTIFTLGF